MDNGKAQDDRASMTKMELVGGAGGGDDALGIPSRKSTSEALTRRRALCGK